MSTLGYHSLFRVDPLGERTLIHTTVCIRKQAKISFEKTIQDEMEKFEQADMDSGYDYIMIAEETGIEWLYTDKWEKM